MWFRMGILSSSGLTCKLIEIRTKNGAAVLSRSTLSAFGEEIFLNIYLDLFLTFAKMGACTFGGGYAMLPILQREVVEKKQWATEEELVDYYAIGQCTPGIIAVNTATFIGHKYKGIPGGIVATLGLVFPCLIIITTIAAFLSNFTHIPVVQHALAGVNACVVALIASAVVKLGKTTLKSAPAVCIFLGVLALAELGAILNPAEGTFLAVISSPAVLVLLSGAVGLLLWMPRGGKEK